MHWKKIFAAALLAVLLAALVAFINGLTIGLWLDHVASIDDAIQFSRQARTALIVVIVGVVYWRLCAKVSARPLLHVALAWLAAIALDFLVGSGLAVVLHLSSHPRSSFSYILSTALAALFGYLVYRLRPNNSSKPTPLRGAA
ncbi:hypothetical protein [Lysobacter sp. HA35]